MDVAESRFVRLVRVVVDGLATDKEAEELRRLSETHPQLVATVLDELTIDALLRWQSGSIIEALPPLEPDGPTVRAAPISTRRLAIPLVVTATAAAVIASAAVLWTFSASPAVDSIVADIVNPEGVDWSADSTALSDAYAVRSGRLASLGGEYTLQFRGGPTVRVVGPSAVDITSKELVYLEHGQVTADVPPSSIGFTITTALVDVVDQGTQFGISAEHDHTEVIVFDGKVDVTSKVDQSGKQKRLTQGEAIKVDGAGEFGRLMDVRRDAEGRWWTGEDPNHGSHIIARVTDNIWGGPEKYQCYHTTYRGLQDDALAYSDNPNHQWNGLTADGLPEFLRGADYIRTFNHFRYMQYFKMTVELSGPANLYVFADNRIPPPEWLVEQFEDTGVDIGLDEGPWLDNIDPEYRKYDVNTVAVGPGKSIDNVSSVWRRRCVDGERVVLGDAGTWGGEGGQGRSMYGVAATPLDAEAPVAP